MNQNDNGIPSDQAVTLTVEAGVARLVLNRPEKHNAFDDEIISALTDCLEHLAGNKDARVLVLSSTGKSFSAGADLSWMKRMAQLSYEENVADARALAKLMSTLNSLPIPSIAKVQGATFGGAIGLISCCDIAIASKHAKFCLSEVKLGLSPATISPFVVAAMGERRCRRLFLTAELFDATQAESWGLIHETVEREQLHDAVSNAVDQILRAGPEASKATKQLIADLSSPNTNVPEYTAELIANLRVSEEGQAGLAAFFDKSSPPWISKSETKS